MVVKSILITFFLILAIPDQPLRCQEDQNRVEDPVISHVFWITIHTRETGIYDSLHHLFVEVLQLPLFFDTETYGTRRYFTVHTGNVILEPCGPFNFHEGYGQNIKTRFNTLAFRPYESAYVSAAKLEKLGFEYTTRDQDALLNLVVDELCTDFIPVNISKTADLSNSGQVVMDSLAQTLHGIGGGPLGLEYVEEIHLGYITEAYLGKWVRFLQPLENDGTLWILPRKPNIRFVRSNREEIMALVFKVKSLEEAVAFLQNAGISVTQTVNRIELDLNQVYGIRIILTDSVSRQ
jgi:hypothetical protein